MKRIIFFWIAIAVMFGLAIDSCRKNDTPVPKVKSVPVQYRIVEVDQNGDTTWSKVIVVQEPSQ